MIDFSKQPHCATCPHCIGYPRSEQRCAENMEYAKDGSCIYAAERRAQCKIDAWDACYDADDSYDCEETEE